MKSWIPVAAIVGGVLCLGLALLLIRPVSKESSGRALARLQPSFGKVSLERNGRREMVGQVRPLQRFDRLETGPDTEAVLLFESGEELRLLDNTDVIVDWESAHPLVLVRSGDVWPEKLSENPSVRVSRDGVRRTLSEDRRESQARQRALNAKTKTSAARATTTAKTPVPLNPIAERTRAKSLSPEYIQETLKTQRNLFFKCYTQLLQRTPGVSGEASIAFTIEKTGRVSTAEISSSSLQDQGFRRCISEAVKRVEFKAFIGDPVSALFPIRFE